MPFNNENSIQRVREFKDERKKNKKHIEKGFDTFFRNKT